MSDDTFLLVIFYNKPTYCNKLYRYKHILVYSRGGLAYNNANTPNSIFAVFTLLVAVTLLRSLLKTDFLSDCFAYTLCKVRKL